MTRCLHLAHDPVHRVLVHNEMNLPVKRITPLGDPIFDQTGKIESRTYHPDGMHEFRPASGDGI